MKYFLRLLAKKFAAKPAPKWMINLWLMARFRCFIRLSADISYPLRIRIGRGATIGNAVLNPGNFRPGYGLVIGANTVVADGAMIHSQGGAVILGSKVSVNPYCVLYGHGGLTVGDNTRIAAATVIVASAHEVSRRDKNVADHFFGHGISIGQDVWIGAGARILDGVTIGDRAVIGAGAVVNRSVAAEAVAVGVPARAVKPRFAP
jgi:acetyltransferase-like isoleucine patch superfamily enzyme